MRIRGLAVALFVALLPTTPVYAQPCASAPAGLAHWWSADGNTGETVSQWWQPPCSVWSGFATGGERSYPSITISPVNGRIYLNTCRSAIAVYHDPVVRHEETETGSNASVSFPEAEITFANVSASGATTVATVPVMSFDANLPGQFELTGALAYEISTTAVITGPIQLCFNVSSITDDATFNALAVLHAENGVWIDRTTSRDFNTGTICARSPSLSPFAIARRKPYLVQPLYNPGKAFRSGSTAPIKIRIEDVTGENVSAEGVPVHVVDLVQRSRNSSALFNDSGNANPDSAFRYSEALGGYILNLSTRGLQAGTYDMRFRIGADGRLYTTALQIR